MGAVRIDALCECEGCGKRFGVEIDIAEELKGGFNADFEALVRDTILGGLATCYTWGVRGKATVDRLSLSYHPTIQADLMLCDVCSRKCDDVPVERNLTRAEIMETLGLPVSDDEVDEACGFPADGDDSEQLDTFQRPEGER